MVPDQEKNLAPDPASIRADLEFMTRRWHELPETPVFELRAFKEGGSGPQRGRFQLDWMDDAIEWAGNLNRLGYQVYPVRNPLRENVTGFATDKDVIAAFYLWADCDDEFAAGNILKFTGPKWSAAVTTGRIPHTRVHIYWELEQPCFDMAEWRATQSRIAAHFGSDQNVINPSRIMRLAGTVTYPDARKRAKGYINELTTIRTAYPDPRPPVTIDAMMRAFGEAPPARQSGPVTPFAIDTGPQPLDRERTRIQALSGQEWHNAVIRLVASYVAKGLSDEEVHQLTEPLTLAGYTAEQTRREVQQAIDGARRKGWTPQPPDAHQFREMTPDERASVPALMFKPWGHRDLAAIPQPEFLYSDFYARGYTSLTVSPPKTGKSLTGLAESVDMASGRGFLTGVAREPLRVVYYNAEDDQNVIDARIAGLLCRYEIEQSEIAETLFPVSGVDAEDFYMVTGQDGIINEALFVALEKFIEASRADVLIFDPLQDLSRSPETNEVFRTLGQRLRRLATTRRVAVGLIHHTRKMIQGATATIDDARGGSALRGTARFNRLLLPMTEDEAVKAGVDNHRHFMRIGDMESNLAPPSADVNRWFRKISVEIPNGGRVGAIEPWHWPDAFDGVTVEATARVQAALREMEDDPPRLNTQSASWVGLTVARILGLDADDKNTRARIATMVKTWIGTGVMEVVEVRDTRNGRDVKAVLAGPNNPKSEGRV